MKSDVDSKATESGDISCSRCLHAVLAILASFGDKAEVRDDEMGGLCRMWLA